MKRLIAFVLGVGLAACGGGGGGGDDGTGATTPAVAFERAYPNLSFDRPLFITSAPGDTTHLYVATQTGQVLSFDARNESISSASMFLDLSDRTRANGEQGLLGLAFDPQYASNGRVYAYYNDNVSPRSERGDSVLARYVANRANRTADRDSEVELLRFAQAFNNHNGGALVFGADGMLYLASGDGGGSGDPNNNAQNLGSLLGKILRLRPDGSVPNDNPFVGTAGARGEIWAYGLRNPFRFSFDGTRLFAGDVGQNAVEEIDLIERGGNYGWPRFEGTRVFRPNDAVPANAIAPVFEYGRENGDRSITGGIVYRGSRIPALTGRYLYGDFVSGRVWALSEMGGVATLNVELGTVPNPSSFGEDLNREPLITAFDGSLRRLVPGAAP